MRALSRYASIVALAIAAPLALGATAQADPVKCQKEIAKAFPKFAQSKIKALQKCNDKVVKGDISGPCPDGDTALKITNAESKLRAAVDKKCGGEDDKSCGVGSDDESLSSIGWDIGACPNIEGASCTNTIANCDQISDCLVCIGEAAVDQAISLFYDDLTGGEFGTNSDTNKCQREIGKAATKFFVAKSKILAKCEKKVLNGDIIGPCPDGIATADIAEAASKKDVSICKKCGGDDKLCGGVADLTTGAIGFATNCPNVTIPGGPSCAASITTVQGIADCVDCLSEFKNDCLDPLSVPDLKAYPSECPGNVASPTPCPTSTPGGSCPTTLQADANGAAVNLDTGWTGIAHDAHVPTNGRLTLGVSGCAGSPPCGVCSLSGPLANAGGVVFNNHRCVGDTAIQCSVDGDCGANGPCAFYFGPPLPLAAGGTAVCVMNRILGSVTGTVDVEAGETSTSLNLRSSVFNGAIIARPCPICSVNKCVGGSNGGAPCARASDCPGGSCSHLAQCDAGPHAGDACTVNGENPTFGEVSFDCPPDNSASIGTIPIAIAYSTGAQTRTLSAANPPCDDTAGFPGTKCFCDTCDNENADPCSANADCVKQCRGGTNNGTNCTDPSECPGGACVGGVCGGRRCRQGANNGVPCSQNSECPGGVCGKAGQATAPNSCADGICTPEPGDTGSVDEGHCSTSGPTDILCGPDATYASCVFDSDCTQFNRCVGGTNEHALGCNRCVGGTNDLNACTVDSECPFGFCNNCPGGTCVVQTCSTLQTRECFTDNSGTIGGDVTVQGQPYPPCGSVGNGVVGALFCIAPTTSPTINAVTGLPGLGRVTLPTTYTFN